MVDIGIGHIPLALSEGAVESPVEEDPKALVTEGLTCLEVLLRRLVVLLGEGMRRGGKEGKSNPCCIDCSTYAFHITKQNVCSSLGKITMSKVANSQDYSTFFLVIATCPSL